MDLITQGLSKIHRSIPRQILDVRYNIIKDGFSNVNSNIEDIVIRGEVFTDLNLMSCNQLVVKISDLVYKGRYGDRDIYDVPSELTNGLSIIEVIGVIADGHSNILMVEGDVTIPSTIRTYLVNRHTISIDSEFSTESDGYIELMLAYDDRLKDINPISYPELFKAFILATKADIYNELSIDLDIGGLYYGYNIDALKSRVDEWSDAREQYEEHMELTVGRILFMSSDEMMSDWVTGMLPNQT